MLFKDGDLAAEFLQVPEDLRSIIRDADDMMSEAGLGQITITAVGRDPSFYKEPHAWSWHFIFHAVDIRTKHLSPSRKLILRDFLERRSRSLEQRCDVLLEHLGQENEHIHIELESVGLKLDWLSRHRAGVV